MAKGIEDAERRSEALREIAEEMAKVGMVEKAREVFEEAMEVAKGIKDAWRRSEALERIAAEMAKVGEFERAMEVAKGIEAASERSEALREIAAEMAKAGEFERAIEVAKGIEDAWSRSRALKRIAAEMAKVGMREKAEEALKQAWQEAKQAASFYELWEVAETAAKIGFTKEAVEFAHQIAGERTERLPRVLDALTEREEREGVKALLALCGWAKGTAIHACKCLIRLYPDHAVSIAEVVCTLSK